MKPNSFGGVGVGSAEMDDDLSLESDPRRLFLDVGTLITEVRVPELSTKGRTEGPHCCLPGYTEHACSERDPLCRTANEVKEQLSSLWYKSVPACIDVLLYPDCCHGEQAATDDTHQGGAASRDVNSIMLEQWTIQVIQRRSNEQWMTGKALTQALRSYLFFSQLSAWYNQTQGRQPRTVVYRVSVPGESDLNLFPAAPVEHAFPNVPISKTTSLKVSSISIPRGSSSIPRVLCYKDHSSHVHNVQRYGHAEDQPAGAASNEPDQVWSRHRTGTRPSESATKTEPYASPTIQPYFTYTLEAADTPGEYYPLEVAAGGGGRGGKDDKMQYRKSMQSQLAAPPIVRTVIDRASGAIPKRTDSGATTGTKSKSRELKAAEQISSDRSRTPPPSELSLRAEITMKTLKSPTVLVTEQPLSQQQVYFSSVTGRESVRGRFQETAIKMASIDLSQKSVDDRRQQTDVLEACGRPMSPAEIEQYLWLLKPNHGRRSESPDTVSPSSVDSRLSPLYLSLNKPLSDSAACSSTARLVNESMCSSTSSNDSNGAASPPATNVATTTRHRGRRKGLKVVPSYERKCLIGRMSDSPSPSPTRVSRRELLPLGQRKPLRGNNNANNSACDSEIMERHRGGFVLSSSDSDQSIPESGSSSSLIANNGSNTGALCDHSNATGLENAFSELHITPPSGRLENRGDETSMQRNGSQGIAMNLCKNGSFDSPAVDVVIGNNGQQSENGHRCCPETNGYTAKTVKASQQSKESPWGEEDTETNGFSDGTNVSRCSVLNGSSIAKSAKINDQQISVSSEISTEKRSTASSSFQPVYTSIQEITTTSSSQETNNGTTRSQYRHDVDNNTTSRHHGDRLTFDSIDNKLKDIEKIDCQVSSAYDQPTETSSGDLANEQPIFFLPDETTVAPPCRNGARPEKSENGTLVAAPETNGVNLRNGNSIETALLPVALLSGRQAVEVLKPSSSSQVSALNTSLAAAAVNSSGVVGGVTVAKFGKQRSLLKTLMTKELKTEPTLDTESAKRKHVPTDVERKQFHQKMENSTQMVFSRQTGLPLQSSPAPVKRNSYSCPGGNFSFDANLATPRAIKNAVSCSILDSSENEDEENRIGHRKLSVSAPASTQRLLGNFEESILNGRIEPVGVVDGFTAEIGASGSFCPKHAKCPVTAYWFSLSDDNAPSPYLGHISLEGVGKKGYHVPKKGTVQVTLFNPNKTVVKMFVVLYDLSDMPPNCQTFLRQRTLYMPLTDDTDDDEMLPTYLRYLIHLRFMSSKSGRIYLHTDIRLIFARDKFEFDPRVATYELRSFTEGPVNPKFSPMR
ncbi:atos homolog protein A-like isoform X2 [Tubulanus polymorphus]|uniref:atos homolog protein A-like isoform X2 n=1 Tax=Tubulanus polymorphus TaxID=672921 RepID=UPI003DA65066